MMSARRRGSTSEVPSRVAEADVSSRGRDRHVESRPRETANERAYADQSSVALQDIPRTLRVITLLDTFDVADADDVAWLLETMARALANQTDRST
jgi:hypothetical protein